MAINLIITNPVEYEWLMKLAETQWKELEEELIWGKKIEEENDNKDNKEQL
jgi:hypothetical protein